MKYRILVAALLVITACDSSSDPGPTTSSSPTTTTIDNDTCDRVAGDTVTYLEDLIDALDQTRLEELTQPAAWGESLRSMQRAGKDLDLRVAALRCDPAVIQQRAFAEADLIPNGPLSAQLLELLLTPSGPEVTTPTVAATTTTTADTNEGSTTTSGG